MSKPDRFALCIGNHSSPTIHPFGAKTAPKPLIKAEEAKTEAAQKLAMAKAVLAELLSKEDEEAEGDSAASDKEEVLGSSSEDSDD